MLNSSSDPKVFKDAKHVKLNFGKNVCKMIFPFDLKVQP